MWSLPFPSLCSSSAGPVFDRCGDHSFGPLLERVILRREVRIGGLVPFAIQVLAIRVETVRPRATPSLFAMGMM